jgi:integrase
MITERGGVMGWVERRASRDGKVRYRAKYRDIRGRKQSAGTFADERSARKAWQAAEVKIGEGRAGDPRRQRQRFQRYVEEEWFPHHRLELRSRENYTYYLNRHIIPWFGPMRMIEILPSHVREFVTKLERDGVPASSIAYCVTILSAIFTTALNEVIFLHPCRGVETPTVPKKIRQIVTPEQFDLLYAALDGDMMRLLVETDIETGLRWGELTELRPKDFNMATRVVTVSRVAIELVRKFHPDGGRFLVKEYPKDEEHRQLTLSVPLIKKIEAHIAGHGLDDDDLLFALPDQPGKPPLCPVPEPGSAGWTEKNAAGRSYRHGSLSGYSAGKCRCGHCKAAYAIYRAERRAGGKDSPRSIRVVVTDGHIPRRWFRDNVWLKAREAAGLGAGVKVHSLRHAHASWLLAGGADLETVKERLGHSSILTTQKYLHTLPDEENDKALDAFAKIRNRKNAHKNGAGHEVRGA